MNNIKEFDGPSNLRSLLNFWLATGPMLAGVLLLTTVVVLWERPLVKDFRSRVWKKLGSFGREKELKDEENGASSAPDSKASQNPFSSTSQPSRLERGEWIPIEDVSSPQPPPSSSPHQSPSQQRSPSQKQLSPSAAYPASTTSTGAPNGSSLQLPSTEQLSTSASQLVQNSRQPGAHADS